MDARKSKFKYYMFEKFELPVKIVIVIIYL